MTKDWKETKNNTITLLDAICQGAQDNYPNTSH